LADRKERKAVVALASAVTCASVRSSGLVTVTVAPAVVRPTTDPSSLCACADDSASNERLIPIATDSVRLRHFRL
jgi:hypothetical protein